MQRTRLNTLVTQTTRQFRQWVFNPWRRLAVIVISLLFGNFFATAISATAGQTAKLDVTISAILVIVVEIISWIYYRFSSRQRVNNRLGRRSSENPGASEDGSLPSDIAMTVGANADLGIDLGPLRSRSTLVESLNAFKLGMIYGLFVEAFKLGS